MDAAERKAIIDHVLGTVSRSALSTALGFDVDDMAARRACLETAERTANAEELGSALLVCALGEIDASFVPSLVRLLDATWHEQHEELARILQLQRDPRAIEALARAAVSHHAYLEDDDGLAMKRKCTWALADIGTPEARAALEGLARGADEVVAGYARKRLDAWDDERDRKRS